MLRLIEEDADSFAKRAEMYYQKRPELVNLVEEFYRAYRSLAERYDYLAGEIRQNIPKALQVQLGLSCDSPKSAGGTAGGRQHQYSPLRKSDKTFDDLLRKAGQAEDALKDSHPMENMQTPERNITHGPMVEHSHCTHLGDDALEFCTRDFSSSKGSSSDADAEVDHLTPLERLQQEIENLEIENRLLMDANGKVLQLNHALEKKVEALEDQFRSISSDGGLPHSLSHRSTTVVGKVSGSQDSHEDGSCLDLGGGQAFACTSGRNLRVLIKENEVLKQAICERGEEKREAIRQLCLSIDILKCENQRLVLLASNKQRRHPRHPLWLKLFCLGD